MIDGDKSRIYKQWVYLREDADLRTAWSLLSLLAKIKCRTTAWDVWDKHQFRPVEAIINRVAAVTAVSWFGWALAPTSSGLLSYSAGLSPPLLKPGTSLVVQGLRISLPMHRTWVWSLIRQLRPHMLGGTTNESCAHQLLSPRALKPVSCRKSNRRAAGKTLHSQKLKKKFLKPDYSFHGGLQSKTCHSWVDPMPGILEDWLKVSRYLFMFVFPWWWF